MAEGLAAGVVPGIRYSYGEADPTAGGVMAKGEAGALPAAEVFGPSHASPALPPSELGGASTGGKPGTAHGGGYASTEGAQDEGVAQGGPVKCEDDEGSVKRVGGSVLPATENVIEAAVHDMKKSLGVDPETRVDEKVTQGLADVTHQDATQGLETKAPPVSETGAKTVKQSGGVKSALLLASQFLCWGMLFFPPDFLLPASVPARLNLDPSQAETASNVGGAMLAIAIALGISSIAAMGSSYTVFPKPAQRSALKTHGPFAWVRHPMYTAHVLLFLALALLSLSPLRLAATLLVVPLLVLKAQAEERNLASRHGDVFRDYKRKVKKMFIPYLF